jgi:type IV secretory pathway VirB10-like protein
MMPFTSRPSSAQHSQRSGRRFRVVLGAVAVLAVAAAGAQWAWFQWWHGDTTPERSEIREVSRKSKMFDYDLPDPPEPQPEILPVQVPVVRTVTEPAPPPLPPKETVKYRKMEKPERRRDFNLPRLASVKWSGAEVKVETAGYRDGRVPMFAEGCALRPGWVIPATLWTAVNSEIPGQVIAQVDSPIYSGDDGYEDKILIPSGTRVVGMVDKPQALSFDRRRLNIAWTDMTLPGGRQIHLGRAFNASVDGSGGVGGHVEHRGGALFVYAVLTTVFNVAQRSSISGDDSIMVDVQNETSSTLGEVGEDVLERSLDWEPVITIPASTLIKVLVNETLQVC